MYTLYVDGELCAIFARLEDAIHMAKRKTTLHTRIVVVLDADGYSIYWVNLR